jgi:hypothetical protein
LPALDAPDPPKFEIIAFWINRFDHYRMGFRVIRVDRYERDGARLFN